MKCARTPWLPLLRALSLLALGSVWAIACGGPQEQGAAGAVCFRTDDCKDGLACVPTAVGSTKSTCSADLGVIVAMVDGAPPDSALPMPDASGGAAGALANGGAGGKALAGAGGKAATGGATGTAGSAAGGKSSGGAPAGGATAGGAPSGGSGVAGSATAGSGTGGSGTSGGSGGAEPVDAGDG